LARGRQLTAAVAVSATAPAEETAKVHLPESFNFPNEKEQYYENLLTLADWSNNQLSLEVQFSIFFLDFLLVILILTAVHLSLFCCWARHHLRMQEELRSSFRQGDRVLPYRATSPMMKRLSAASKPLTKWLPPISLPPSPPSTPDVLLPPLPPPLPRRPAHLAPLANSRMVYPLELRPLGPLRPLTLAVGSDSLNAAHAWPGSMQPVMPPNMKCAGPPASLGASASSLRHTRALASETMGATMVTWRPQTPGVDLEVAPAVRRPSAVSVGDEESELTSTASEASVDRLSLKLRLKVNYLDGFSYVPDIVWWPNIEVMVILLFAPALVQRAITVVSHDAQHEGAHGVATMTLIFLGMFFVHEAARVIVFVRQHGQELWHENRRVELRQDMDDPLLSKLVGYGIGRPALRSRGFFEQDGDSKDWDEPRRTYRALREPLAIRWWRRRPGDMHATLAASWLINGGGGYRGATYLLAKAAFQVLYSFGIGLAVRSSGLAGVEGALVVLLAVVQLCLGLYCWRLAAPADRLEAIFAGFEATLSSMSLLLRFASVLAGINDALMATSVITLAVAIYSTLLLPIYDLTQVIARTMKARKERLAKQARRAAALQRARDGSPSKSPRKERVMSEEEMAAAKMQSVVRGRSSRRKTQLQRELMMQARHEKALKEVNAASTITKAYKIRMMKLEIRRKAEAHEKNVRERGAATVIQASFRGSRYRKKEKVEHNAATTIQSAQRGKVARHLLEDEMAERVEMRERNRVREAKERKAAITIQKAIRGLLARAGTMKKRAQRRLEAHASLTIAVFWRLHCARILRRLDAEKQRIKEEDALLKARLDAMEETAHELYDKHAADIRAAAQRRREKREVQIKAAIRITALARGVIARRVAPDQMKAYFESMAGTSPPPVSTRQKGRRTSGSPPPVPPRPVVSFRPGYSRSPSPDRVPLP